jgi:hypothetical protein
LSDNSVVSQGLKKDSLSVNNLYLIYVIYSILYK